MLSLLCGQEQHVSPTDGIEMCSRMQERYQIERNASKRETSVKYPWLSMNDLQPYSMYYKLYSLTRVPGIVRTYSERGVVQISLLYHKLHGFSLCFTADSHPRSNVMELDPLHPM